MSGVADFSAHYEKELDGLVRLAFVICGDVQVAEDTVADAVVKVWRHWRRGHVDDLGAYLRRAVVNELIGRVRREGRHRNSRHLIGASDPPPRVEESVEDRAVIVAALRMLPVDQRAVVALRYLCDLSELETADVLGLPLGTVKSRAARAVKRLRLEMEGSRHG